MKIIIKIIDNYYEDAATDDDVDGAADGDDNRFEGRVVCPWKSKEVDSCAKSCLGMPPGLKHQCSIKFIAHCQMSKYPKGQAIA